MSASLEFTGERFTPECMREIWYEHFHRYALAVRWCEDQHTLDAACGEGYGSALLSRSASKVEGVDISEEAIKHAQGRYGHLDNVNYQVADCTRLPFADDEFDRVVSFETLEHLQAHDELLTEFRRVLKPGGLLILSSPDKAIYTDELKTDNEYHIRELYRDELESLLGRYFPAFQLLGQKLMFHSAIWSMDTVDGLSLDQISEGQLDSPDRITQSPVYFIALCGGDEACLPETSGQMWLFDDHEESVYRHYYEEIRRHIAAGGIIAELEEKIADLTGQLERAGSSQPSWWRRLLGLR